MKKKKVKKYQLGTGKNGVVRHYIESPAETMVENDIMMAKAKAEAADNQWAKGLDLFGNMAIQYGMSQAGGLGGVGQGIGEGMGNIFGGNNTKGMMEIPGAVVSRAAFGGTAGEVPVEVEGDEVAELPDGGLIDFEGPSHEDGGINTNLPEGTDIFSKRIKVSGKTMAERRLARMKKEKTLTDLLKGSNSHDVVLNQTLKRTQENNAMEQEKDKRLQHVVKLLHGMTTAKVNPGTPQEASFGTFFKGLFGDSETGEKGSLNFTGGDLVGLAGTLYSAFEPMKNTQEQRAGDTPNINAFKDFGVDALDTMESAKSYIGSVQDNALQDIESSRTKATLQNRQSARGVNVMRALDTATQLNADKAKGDIYDKFATQMMNMLTRQAGLENEQDLQVMTGEQTRDDADRRDRDNYYSQLAKDIASKGQGIQQAGKMLNQNKANTVSENLLNQTSKNYRVDSNGNILLKSGDREMSVEESLAYAQSLGFKTVEAYLESLLPGATTEKTTD
jgi:hypothetical protein